MKTTRKLSRRSFLGRVAGGVAGGAALTILGASKAEAQVSDSDTGQYADPVGRGRGNGYGNTGCSDSDSGNYADPGGNGRGRRRGGCSGLTDSDRGSWSDPARCGRGRHN